MRMHVTVVDKLMYLFQNYGGHERDLKLRRMLEELDLTPYERQTGMQELILVLTEDYMKQLASTGR
ncbi:MAG: hypothetical protein E6R04_02495 [Spirochaetes bacterium]|nr:MAG: hypothetical protein E6R04_02495 [Spirochaetota bacterium]